MYRKAKKENQMQFKIHYPTQQFGFIEIEIEGSFQDVCNPYKELEHTWKKTPEFGKEPAKPVGSIISPEQQALHDSKKNTNS